MMLKNLEKAGFNPAILEETKNWSNVKRSFVLEKDEVIFLPSSVQQFNVGLGWSTRCDLDASILLLDQTG